MICFGVIQQVSFAQTGNDATLLRGEVLSTCYVQITPEAVATNLDLIGAGHTNTKVADVQVFSNATAMATAIGISDDTGALLVNQDDGSFDVPYTLNYSSVDTGNSAPNFAPTTTPTTLDFRVGVGGFSGVLEINLTADPTLPAGDYQANVTIACSII